jgi:carbonic anhydrase
MDVRPGGVSRRGVLGLGALAVGALAGCGSDTAAVTKDAKTGESPEPAASTAPQALARLRAGNQRFAASKQRHPDQTKARRTELARGQHPFALVLACVDSRVPPELVFDQGLGDLFVARSAGQVLDDAVVGSIEYGVAELHVPLVVVLGHEKCGAVKATLEAVEKKSPALGNDIDALVTAIRPAVEKAEAEHASDALDAAVRYNVANIVAELKSGPVLKPAVAAGTLQVVGARYALNTGIVSFL